MAEVRYDYDEIKAAADALAVVSEEYYGHSGADVHDIVPSGEACGHADAASAVSEFADRWDDQLDQLIKSCQGASALLQHILTQYVEWDEEGAATLRDQWWSRG